jgi:hypothetical protein
MTRLASASLPDAAEALRSAYRSAQQIDMLLQERLERRFDDLTSRYLPLKDNIFEIVQKAQDQGWSRELMKAARADRPSNETLGAFVDSLPPEAPRETLSPRKSQIDRPSLLCGRAIQWNEVCQSAPAQFHQVILVPGERGQEPLHFRDRVQTFLTPDPTRLMLLVHWQTPPAGLGEMIEALARTFGDVAVDALPQAIAEKLAHQNVVLLHPCLTQGFTQEHLVAYYTKWIPEVLARQPTFGNLKCVQPVEWPIDPQQHRSFLSRLLPRGEATADGRAQALKLIADLRGKQASNMRVLDVDELTNLERREIEKFLEASVFPVEHQKLLFSQLMGGPQVPGFMFKTIDDYWRGIADNG